MSEIRRIRHRTCRRIAACLVAPCVLLSACAPVQPWERGTLAKPHMAIDPFPLQRALDTHVRDSREAASGGDAAAGGGCGCN